MKISHKAWTVERELSSLEEDYMGSQDMDHHTSTLENKIPTSQIANIVHEGMNSALYWLLYYMEFSVFFLVKYAMVDSDTCIL